MPKRGPAGIMGADSSIYRFRKEVDMIPISDASRRPLHIPIMTILIILVNAGVFLLELAGGDAFVNQWSVIPAHIVAGRDYLTVLTAMFMHAGWLHIIGNMIFLW